MKKAILAFIAAAFCALAGVEAPFIQFTQADYCNPHESRADQNWFGAQLITLHAKGGTSVWLSNYVNSFFAPVKDLHGSQFDMVGTEKYGYIYKDSLDGLKQEDYSSLIHWSDGSKQTMITYTYDPDPSITATTKGYLLDEFAEDAEIYLVMTTLAADGGETVDSYQYVQDAGHDTTLQSRQHNTSDLAGNVRINYGINSATYGEIGREFVAVYDGNGPSGQPLPGVFIAGLLALGVVGGASKLKKRS